MRVYKLKATVDWFCNRVCCVATGAIYKHTRKDAYLSERLHMEGNRKFDDCYCDSERCTHENIRHFHNR